MKPGHVAMTNSDGGALWGRPSKDLAGQHGPGEVLWLAGGNVQPSGHVTEQPECGGPQGNFPYPDFFAHVHYCQQIF